MFFIVVKLCFYQSQGLLSFSCPASEEAGGHKKLAGDIARTSDPDWSRGYSMPYDIPLSIQTQGNGLGTSGWELLGHWSVSSKQLHGSSLVLHILLLSSLLSAVL